MSALMNQKTRLESKMNRKLFVIVRLTPGVYGSRIKNFYEAGANFRWMNIAFLGFHGFSGKISSLDENKWYWKLTTNCVRGLKKWHALGVNLGLFRIDEQKKDVKSFFELIWDYLFWAHLNNIFGRLKRESESWQEVRAFKNTSGPLNGRKSILNTTLILKYVRAIKKREL